MTSAESRIFFPLLTRQSSYPKNRNDEYYSYSHYRKHVAEDCENRCVYCDAYESEVGGAEAMQLDHFRPESLEEFKHLKNTPTNLHYSCARCNLLKSNHWPSEDEGRCHNGVEGFVDPFEIDRLEYFEIAQDGGIYAINPPASYQIRLLRLDRGFLNKLRELRILKVKWKARAMNLKERLESGDNPNKEEIISTLSAIAMLLD